MSATHDGTCLKVGCNHNFITLMWTVSCRPHITDTYTHTRAHTHTHTHTRPTMLSSEDTLSAAVGASGDSLLSFSADREPVHGSGLVVKVIGGCVKRLLVCSVKLQWTRTHLCPLIELSWEGDQLWMATHHWVPDCLWRTRPLFPSHLVVYQ